MQEQTWWKLRCASCLLVFCAVVWCCLLVTKWAMKKKIQTYPYSNCTFHHQNSQRKQTNFTVPTNLIENFGQHNLLYVSLSAWKTEQNPCKNKHGENCIAQVVCWYFVRLCGAAGVGCEVSEGKKTIQIYPYSNCTFHHQNSQRKQTIFYHTNQPYWKLWPTQSTVCVSFSMENRRETMQEQTWWKLHCASCLLVFCAVVWCCWCWLRSEWGKKTIQTHPYSNCTFHHQSSQRKQTSFTVPADLGKTLANTIYILYVYLSACWKTGQNPCKNKHGETCIAQVVCWYFVRLCGTACWLRSERWKKTSKPIHILTALFTTRIHKENKQILPYQPTSGKLWPT